MDSTIETAQPMGHEIQMPVVPSAVRESSSASATRSTRSVNVATMNCFISPAPRCLLLPEFRALSGCASAHQQPVHAAGHRRPARSASSSARAIRSALPPVSWSGCSWPPGRGVSFKRQSEICFKMLSKIVNRFPFYSAYIKEMIPEESTSAARMPF